MSPALQGVWLLWLIGALLLIGEKGHRNKMGLALVVLVVVGLLAR
jgi:hypothetical protein